jgi:cellulose synthase/poly-beta-1,6-N-acetylglucosamine synthase-like glycosyltransferase
MEGIFYLATAIGMLLSLPAWGLLLLTILAGKRPQALDAALAQRAYMSTVTLAPAHRVAVLVPAHNESIHILPTIECLLSQLLPGDRLLVVADNCTDDTAALAMRAGATVIERHNADLRGKGYALAFGVDALRADPPDVVLVIDADCTVSENAIPMVSARCVETGCPVQMLDLMKAPEGAGLRIRILEFAWRVKNFVRPLGAYRLGGACHLMGTGMAIPWALMSRAKLATGHVAEDMKLGVDMALSGHPTHFFKEAQVTSLFPADSDVARAQKSRWEHGHLRTLTEELPRLLMAAIRTGRMSLWVLSVDLLIPPLALYFLIISAMTPVALVVGFLSASGQALAAVVVSAALAFAVAIGIAWWRFGRDLLSLRELISTPLYALWKIPVYVAYALRKRSGWVRTQRK